MSVANPHDETGFGVIHRSLRGQLTAYELAVYVALSWRANGAGECWPRHKVIAEDAGCSTRQVQYALSSLRDKGLVTWEPHHGEGGEVVSNTYRLAPLGGAHDAGGYAHDAGGVRTRCTTPMHTMPTERDSLNETQGTIEPSPPPPDGDVDLFGAPAAPAAPPVAALFERWWEQYPRKVGKQTARKAFERAVAGAGAQAVMEGSARNFPALRMCSPKFTPHPATWLNAGRWADDPLSVAAGGLPDRGERRNWFADGGVQLDMVLALDGALGANVPAPADPPRRELGT